MVSVSRTVGVIFVSTVALTSVRPFAQQRTVVLREWNFDAGSGEYVLSKLVNGELQRVTFTPGTHIAPRIMSTLSSEGDTTVYAYEIVNSEGATQSLRSCDVPIIEGTRVERTPMEWESTMTPNRGFMSWFKLNRGGSLGIEPGRSEANFVLRSEGLPGIANARCQGRLGGPALPEWASDAAKRELGSLMNDDFVDVPVIAPVIDLKRLELPRTAVLLVRTHYAAELRRVAGGSAIDNELLKAQEELTGSMTAKAVDRLEMLERILESQSGEAWRDQLNAALRICVSDLIRRIVNPQ